MWAVLASRAVGKGSSGDHLHLGARLLLRRRSSYVIGDVYLIRINARLLGMYDQMCMAHIDCGRTKSCQFLFRDACPLYSDGGLPLLSGPAGWLAAEGSHQTS